MPAWRIARAAHQAFDGEGARRHGSRWTPRGAAVVFVSETLSLAALERFVHADPDLEPADLLAIPVDIPADLAVARVGVDQLPGNWRGYPPPPVLTRLGAAWLATGQSAVLSVPSVVIPHERNLVLDPAHPHFPRLGIGSPEPFSFDPRMWKTRR